MRLTRWWRSSGAGKHSLFLVEKGMPGFSLGQRIKDKCGMRASATAEIVFDNVKVTNVALPPPRARPACPPRL